MLRLIDMFYRKHWESFVKAARLLTTSIEADRPYEDAIDEACATSIEPDRIPEATHLLRSMLPEHGWGEHPDYPLSDWKYEVSNEDTRLGYNEWLLDRLETDLPTDSGAKDGRCTPLLAVILEGGLVQCIISDNPDYYKDQSVLVIDYDVSDDNTIAVPQGNGHETDAYVSELDVSQAAIDLKATTEKHRARLLDEMPITLPLVPFRVNLHEEPGDKFQLVFDCRAEDGEHAIEQAENAYPGCEIIHAFPFNNADETHQEV